MARSAAYSSLGTTRTTYFKSDKGVALNGLGGTVTGVSQPGDGNQANGLRVAAAAANTTNVLVYVNGTLVGTVAPGVSEEYVTIAGDRTASGWHLELAAASGTVAGTYGTIDG